MSDMTAWYKVWKDGSIRTVQGKPNGAWLITPDGRRKLKTWDSTFIRDPIEASELAVKIAERRISESQEIIRKARELAAPFRATQIA